RAGVERRDLGIVVVRGAHEPRGVLDLGHMDALAVDPVPLQPRPVVEKVLAHGADKSRRQAQPGHAETDVGSDAAAADVQLLGEERQRQLVELVHHQGVGEPTGEPHQVISSDRPGDRDVHDHRVYALTGQPLTCLTASVRERRQWNESPHAHDPVAFGLSIVKPCRSMVSTKSIVAPVRYGALIRSTTTLTPSKSSTASPSSDRSSKNSW